MTGVRQGGKPSAWDEWSDQPEGNPDGLSWVAREQLSTEKRYVERRQRNIEKDAKENGFRSISHNCLPEAKKD